MHLHTYTRNTHIDQQVTILCIDSFLQPDLQLREVYILDSSQCNSLTFSSGSIRMCLKVTVDLI